MVHEHRVCMFVIKLLHNLVLDLFIAEILYFSHLILAEPWSLYLVKKYIYIYIYFHVLQGHLYRYI